MKQEYDFSRGRRGAVVPQRGKTRITVYVDNDVLDVFRSFSGETGTGYQTMINEALRGYMSNNQPIIEDSEGKSLACHAIALAAVLVDDDERILMLSHPIRNEDGSWEIVGGGLEVEESVLEGTLREVREEVGEDIQVRALGTVHIHTFYRDDTVQFNTGIYYLLAYHGGQIIPGGDMTESEYRWWTLDEIEREHPKINTPRQQWILWRAIELYRLWKNSDIDLQPDRKLC